MAPVSTASDIYSNPQANSTMVEGAKWVLASGAGAGIYKAILLILKRRSDRKLLGIKAHDESVKLDVSDLAQWRSDLIHQNEEQAKRIDKLLDDRMKEAAEYQKMSGDLRESNSILKTQLSNAIYEIAGLKAALERATAELTRANDESAQLRVMLTNQNKAVGS